MAAEQVDTSYSRLELLQAWSSRKATEEQDPAIKEKYYTGVVGKECEEKAKGERGGVGIDR